MQRFFFLFLIIGISSCQKRDSVPEFRKVENLLHIYYQLPGHLQKENLAELMLLNTQGQKNRLKQAIKEAEKSQKNDSLFLTYCQEPYFNFASQEFSGPYAKPFMDTFLLMVRNFTHLAETLEFYRLEPHQVIHKKVKFNLDCVGLQQSQAFYSPKCIISLIDEKKSISNTDFKTIQTYLAKSGIESFPSEFEYGCLDGNRVSILFKSKGRYKFFKASCPPELHPAQQLMDQIINLLENEN